MMTQEQIQSQSRTIREMLESQRLKEAITQLSAMLSEASLWKFSQRLEQISTSYDLMLKYFASGMEDPSRDSLFRSLLDETYQILDSATLYLMKDAESTRLAHALKGLREDRLNEEVSGLFRDLESYRQRMSLLKARQAEKKDLEQEAHRHDVLESRLFETLWAIPLWSKDIRDLSEAFLGNPQAMLMDMALVVSAALLSLTDHFDPVRCEFILSACRHPRPEIQMRALTALVLTLRLWEERIRWRSQMLLRIEELLLDEEIEKKACDVYLGILLQKDTEKIQEKMEKDILPRFREVQMARKDQADPEWVLKVDEDLEGGLKRITNLSAMGGDIHYLSFRTLKGADFFRTLHHWFLPFDELSEAAVRILETDIDRQDRALMNMILFGGLCDNDRYTLLQMFPHLPKAQLRQILSATDLQDLDGEDGSIKDSLQEALGTDKAIAVNFCHDLYRFFMLHPERQQYQDPFSLDWSHDHVAVLRDHLLTRTGCLAQAGSYLLLGQHYQEAARALSEAVRLQPGKEAVIRKAGYALEKTGDLLQAVRMYSGAAPASRWATFRMGRCLRKMEKPQKAVQCYERFLEREPDDKAILFEKAECLVEMGAYPRALEDFCHLEVLEEEGGKMALRRIVWCSLMLERDQMAREYLQRLMQGEVEAQDELYMGHLSLISGAIRDAVQHYHNSLVRAGGIENFRALFRSDEVLLRRRSIRRSTMRMVLDLMLSF